MNNNKPMSSNTKQTTYYVQGMHCQSCQLVIHQALVKHKPLLAVHVDGAKKTVTVTHGGQVPSLTSLNGILAKKGYLLSLTPFGTNRSLTLARLGLVLLAVVVFVFSFRVNAISSLLTIDSQSSFLVFFAFGLLAGVSSCAAVVGGMVLAQTKHWSGSARPYWYFIIARLLTYVMLGGLFGALGTLILPSIALSSLVSVLVTLAMFLFGLQMLGIEWANRLLGFQTKLFGSIFSRKTIAKQAYYPWLLGFVSFFLPCGFSLTAQTMAITSLSPVKGALMLMAFALGTTPSLVAIGLGSRKLANSPALSRMLMPMVGLLVIIFAGVQLTTAMTVLGISPPSVLSDTPATPPVKSVNSELVDGVQVLKISATASAYTPNYFQVTKDIPVRLEVTDNGVSGCSNTLVSRGLFEGRLVLGGGRTSIKQFTPTKVGRFRFSCSMGMITGFIEVVE